MKQILWLATFFSLITVTMAFIVPPQSNRKHIGRDEKNKILPAPLSYHYDSVRTTSTYRFENDRSAKTTAFARVLYPVFPDAKLNDLVKKTVLSPFTTKHMLNNSLIAALPLSPSTDPVYHSASGYKELTSNFIKQFESQAADETLNAYWYADVSVNVVSSTNDYISCLCKTDYFAGGLHDEYDYTYLNYDTRSHQLISLASQFKSNKLNQLSQVAERIFRANEKLSPTQALDGYFFDDNKFELTSNFTITDQGLKFLYIPYEIKPFAAGTTELIIPFSELKNLVLPNSILASHVAH